MIFQWAKRKFQLARIRGATEDLERFIAGLRGSSDDELGMLLAMATLMRLEMGMAGCNLRQVLGEGEPLPEAAMWGIQADLSKIIRKLQKAGSLPQAGAVMVWLHSVRSLNIIEVRSLGRQMWQELARGMPYAEDAAESLRMIGVRVNRADYDEYEFLPPALEPID